MNRRVRITTGKQGRTPRSTVHIDAAELPNPYEEKWLRPRDGRDHHVQDWLLKQPGVATRYADYLDMIETRRPATISVVCSAGKHRSVAVAEWLTAELTAQGWEVETVHRQLKTSTRTTTATAPKRDMAGVTVVTGPPAAGKTTHVRQHAQPGDVIIDYDLIANALSGQDEDNHEHPAHIQTVTKAARQAALEAAINTSARVWLIHAMPSEKQQVNYSARGAEIITIDPGKEIVMKRIKAERPARMAKAAGQWYTNQNKPAGKANTTQRGYGWEHQKARERLLRQHRDGTPCAECGKPMYRDPARNHDEQPLHADHGPGHAQKYAKDKRRNPPTRLLHGSCNTKGGAWDKPRPHAETAEENGFNWGALGQP